VKVTGYKLQAAIKRAKSGKEIQNHLFNENLFQFDSESEENLDNNGVWDEWMKEENKLVKLQVLQQEYNQGVIVNVMGEEFSLNEVVKRLGVATRAERVWKQAAKGSTYKTRKERHWNRDDSNKVREDGSEYAKPTFSVTHCQEKAKSYGIIAGAMKEAVQGGNAKEIDLAGASEGLFD